MQPVSRPILLSGFAIQAWTASIVFHGVALSAIWGLQGVGGSGIGLPGNGPPGTDSLEVSVGANAVGEKTDDVLPDQTALIGPAQDEVAGAVEAQAISAPTVRVEVADLADVATQLKVEQPMLSAHEELAEPDGEPASSDSASPIMEQKTPIDDGNGDQVKDSKATAASGNVRGVHTDPEFEANAIEYPEAARSANLQGTVLLRVQVGHNGRVDSVSVVKSSGATMLDDAAANAVKTWRGRPARRDGRNVDSSVLLPVIFRLR